MGNRITRVTTKTGDQGITRLGDGTKISKGHARIELIGAIDELQCAIGTLLAEIQDEAQRAFLLQIQQSLFNLNGEVAMPGFEGLKQESILLLEEAIELLNRTLPPLKDFVVPGADRKSAACHVARSVCRRAERRLVILQQEEALRPLLVVFLNRLSDYLFVLARTLHHATGLPEQIWLKDGG